MPNVPSRPLTRIYRWVAFASILVCGGLVITRDHWLRGLATSLVCQESLGISDAVVIDNVNNNYLLFERAQNLQARGVAETVLIPIMTSETYGQPESVSLGIVQVLCQASRLRNCVTFWVPSSEPISLNIAKRSAEELQARGARSVIIITDGFRSRRSAEIYTHVFRPRGLTNYIQPVFGRQTPGNWFKSLHGLQDIGLQLIKLWYYRIVIF